MKINETPTDEEQKHIAYQKNMETFRTFSTLLNNDYTQLKPAFRYAASIHKYDFRKDLNFNTEPYILHPIRNTLTLIRAEIEDFDILQASLFHDTVEDHPYEMSGLNKSLASEDEARSAAVARLGAVYGSKVATLVLAVSNPLRRPEEPWKAYMLRYQAHVEEALQDDESALVKAADLIDNAGTITSNVKNLKRAKNLARKYAPLIPLFKERFEHFPIEKVSRAGRKMLSSKFNEIENNLNNL